MSWKTERDALIAETMAFVQSVSGRSEGAGRADSGVAPAAAELPAPPQREARPDGQPAEPIKAADLPSVFAGSDSGPRPATQGDMVREIRARVASFRAHQERFTREREEYFSKTLARLKAALNEMDRNGLGK